MQTALPPPEKSICHFFARFAYTPPKVPCPGLEGNAPRFSDNAGGIAGGLSKNKCP